MSTPLMLLMLAAVPSGARAAYIIDVQQVGDDVVATGSGKLDLTALGSPTSGNWGGMLWAAMAGAWVGPSSYTDVYSGAVSSTSSFGTTGINSAPSNTGTITGIFGVSFNVSSEIYVPVGYVFGTDLSGSSTWSNTTIAGLGLERGTYTWTWGTAATADSFTVNIQPAPEPSVLALLGVPFGLMLLARRQRTA